jgi:dihydroflavonol-4-reductase
MWDVHVVGTQNVLAAAREAGVRRIVHLSSSGTVAVSKDPDVRDEASPTPNDLVSQWPNYRAKLYTEQIALATKGIEVVSLNPSLLLGPGDRERRSVRVVESHLEGWLRAIPPGGLSFVDARDVAEAVASALVRGTPGRRYLLGAANWTFADFYGRIARISGIPAPSFKLPRIASRALPWLGNMDVSEYTGGVDRWELDLACRFWYLDARRARHELGWEPRDPMDTLQDTVDDLRGHRIR